MAFKTWKEAASHLRRAAGPPTKEQRAIGELVGVTFPRGVPRPVAAVMLRQALSDELDSRDPLRDVSSVQTQWLETLAVELGRRPPSARDSATANAWIRAFLLKRRLNALKELKLFAGDVVITAGHVEEMHQVASIGRDGAVYFKGGRARSWPDLLTVVARIGDHSREATQLRQQAANIRALSTSVQAWSQAKHDEIRAFETGEGPTPEEIDQLRSIVDMAADEKPIQVFLETHPHLMTAILSGNPRYCVPQVHVGTKYVADFFISDVDSKGIQWAIVELESPRSPVVLSRGRRFEHRARNGIDQVKDWREWLIRNLDQAHRRMVDEGLGLPDIRPDAEGLVLVGRRYNLRPTAASMRAQLEEKERIRVRTYDWFLNALESVLTFNGPPVLNRDLFQWQDDG